MSDLLDILKMKKQELEEEIQADSKKIAELPEEILQVHRYKGRCRMYAYDPKSDVKVPSKHPRYLKESEHDLGRKLMVKKDLELNQDLKVYQVGLIDSWIDQYDDKYEKRLQDFENSENRKEILGTLPYETNCAERDEWLKADYVKNTYNPKGLNVPIRPGINVRSKSESEIYRALERNGIAFRYEELLEFKNGFRAAPDFTIWLPEGKRLYWEHVGGMEWVDYMDDQCRKFPQYWKNGILPARDMILTFEAKDWVIAPDEINNCIEYKIKPRLKGYLMEPYEHTK